MSVPFQIVCNCKPQNLWLCCFVDFMILVVDWGVIRIASWEINGKFFALSCVYLELVDCWKRWYFINWLLKLTWLNLRYYFRYSGIKCKLSHMYLLRANSQIVYSCREQPGTDLSSLGNSGRDWEWRNNQRWSLLFAVVHSRSWLSSWQLNDWLQG